MQNSNAISKESAPIRLFLIKWTNQCHGNNRIKKKKNGGRSAGVYCVYVSVCEDVHARNKRQQKRRQMTDGEKWFTVFSFCAEFQAQRTNAQRTKTHTHIDTCSLTLVHIAMAHVWTCWPTDPLKNWACNVRPPAQQVSLLILPHFSIQLREDSRSSKECSSVQQLHQVY